MLAPPPINPSKHDARATATAVVATSDFRGTLGLVAASALGQARRTDRRKRRRRTERTSVDHAASQAVVDCFERCTHGTLQKAVQPL